MVHPALLMAGPNFAGTENMSKFALNYILKASGMSTASSKITICHLNSKNIFNENATNYVLYMLSEGSLQGEKCSSRSWLIKRECHSF